VPHDDSVNQEPGGYPVAVSLSANSTGRYKGAN